MTRLGGVFLIDLHRYAERSSVRAVLGALLRSPGYLACIFMRLQNLAVDRQVIWAARILRYIGIAVLGFDSVPGSKIGPGLLMPHPSGIVIGKGVIIGENATLLQQVTLGERHLDGRGPHFYPQLGDNVTVAAGAKVLGNVRVHDGTIIGANSVVISDCPPNSVVAGVPARVVKIQGAAMDRTSVEEGR